MTDHQGARHRMRGERSLAGRASRAAGWSFTSTAVGKLGTVGVGIMLARILGPHAFGTYAVAYVALRILTNFNDLGVGLAIVRWPGDPGEIAPTVATIASLTSMALYAGCYFGAPVYASSMGAPAATSVVRVLCIVVVVDGIVATPGALLRRNFRQGLLMIADQVNLWLGTGVTIALALAGFGAMSLAIGRMAGCAAALVLMVRFSPSSLRFGFDPAKARALLRFGLPLAGSGLILFAVENVDQLVVGRMLGATALGFFVLASNLSNWPLAMFSQPLRGVAPAAFSRLQHDPAAMRGAFLSVAGLLGAVALPVCLIISGAAVPLIGFVYGARWLPATHVLVWLALLTVLQIFFELTYDYFVVLAMSRVVFTLQLAWIIVLIPALIAGAKMAGISGLAIAETAVAAGLILPWYLVELHKAGVRSSALAGRLWLPLAGSVLAGGFAAGAAKLVPNALLAVACSALAGVIIIGLLLYRMRALLALLRRSWGRQAAQGIAAPPADAAGTAAAVAGPGSACLGSDGASSGSPTPAGNSTHRPAEMPVMPDAWLWRPVCGDSTGPLPIWREVSAGFAPRKESGSAPMPMYRATVASLRWDPAATPHRGHGNSQSQQETGSAHPLAALSKHARPAVGD